MFFKDAVNEHLSADTAKLLNLESLGLKLFARPSYSDQARIRELEQGIYFSDNYLHERLLASKPSVLIDLGANIGTSTASLTRCFPSVSTVIGVEPDVENFRVLKANYTLWAQEHRSTAYVPVQAVISARDDDTVMPGQSLRELGKPNLSASGTLRFDLADRTTETTSLYTPVLSMERVLSSLEDLDGGVLCKVDVEGFEERLFQENTSWGSRVAYLTIEIHDRFDESLAGTSRNLLSFLHEFDFAIAPERDVLHCYSRHHLGLA